MNILRAIIQLSRPVNVLISFLTIFVAAELAWGLSPFNNVLLAAFSAALITIGANVINDYFDIKIDRINKPNRPLAAGRISKKLALTYFILVYLIAWLLALYIDIWMFVIALVSGLLLFFYSFRLKRTVLWGNLTVSLSTAMAFIYGGLAVGHVAETIFPAGAPNGIHRSRGCSVKRTDIRSYRSPARTERCRTPRTVPGVLRSERHANAERRRSILGYTGGARGR